MYVVVFRTIVECTHKGVITWTTFRSKEDFDSWYDEKMRSWYEIVAEGVTEERALELVSSPEAQEAVLISHFREIGECMSEAGERLQQL